jgi:ketosteroid isomerase-like protein
MDRSLEDRIGMLEDIEEIKKLKAGYLYSIDDRDWDNVLGCFAEDARVDYGPWGRYEGKKEIEKFFKETIPPLYSLHHHVTHDPFIEVDGKKAKGRWNLEEAATIIKGNKAIWISGRYDDEYVKEKTGWKYKSISVTFFYVTPYEEGWAKKRMIEAEDLG